MKRSTKCVYCFHELTPDDVCFEDVRNTEDPVKDEAKYRYMQMIKPGISEYEQMAMSRPITLFRDRPAGEFLIDDDTGFPTMWKQPTEGGFTLTNRRRLCGYCHMPLPEKFGKCPNVLIGFCGNSGSGKTVYMMSLLHDLMQIQGMSVNWDGALGTQGGYAGNSTINYSKSYRDMYQGTDKGFQLPPATLPTDILPPLVLNCMYGNREFTLTAYDMAGEGMAEEYYMARMANYLSHVNGVVYLKDPEYFPGFSKADRQLDEHQYLGNVFERISVGDEQRGGEPAHIAITMTKIDLLLDRYEFDGEFRRKIGTMFDASGVTDHTHGFDIPRARSYNKRMRELYEWDMTRDNTILTLYANQQKRKSAEEKQKRRGLFGRKKPRHEESEEDDINQRAMLFGVSPLGRGIEVRKSEEDGLSYADHAPNGLHNADPVLWILYCCGLYPARRGLGND